jgi:hypothetical protein
MAKRTVKSNLPAAAEDVSPGAVVKTIAGEEVPEVELAHIAPHLRVFAVAISSLTRDPKNARAHDKRSLVSKANTLREFGQQELLQFDPATRVVKVGNGRHEAAEQILEWKWVAAVGSNLPEAKLRAFALAHNRTGETSAWNMEALQKELDALESASAAGGALEEMSLDDLGFAEDDLADLEEEATRRAAKKPVSVEAKEHKSVEGVMHQIVIKCTGARHQTMLLKAFVDLNAKAIIKHMNGADVRSQSV